MEEFNGSETKPYVNTVEDAVSIANESAMSVIHQPMFLSAWKDAVSLYPKYFVIPQKGIDQVENWRELAPNWDEKSNLGNLKPNSRWTLLAIWSLVDAKKVRSILKELGRDASQQGLDLMSFQWLAKSTATNRRDILTRLFAYY
ncbi:hypothetical protein [Pseudoalteromonas sp. B62]|uniref:hypothetical protein n=1 Tax=Pseudoalteromonas sp. B62 TaxID=630483 RepID=UPI00301D83F5